MPIMLTSPQLAPTAGDEQGHAAGADADADEHTSRGRRPAGTRPVEQRHVQRHGGDDERREVRRHASLGPGDEPVAHRQHQHAGDRSARPLAARRRGRTAQPEERVQHAARAHEAAAAHQERGDRAHAHADREVRRAPDEVHGGEGQRRPELGALGTKALVDLEGLRARRRSRPGSFWRAGGPRNPPAFAGWGSLFPRCYPMRKPRPGPPMRERFAADHLAATRHEQRTWWVSFIESRTLPRARSVGPGGACLTRVTRSSGSAARVAVLRKLCKRRFFDADGAHS